MMPTTMFIWSAIFFVALFVLLKASDYFTDSAEKIGLMLGLSPFIVGATIVSVGTSLPELISSILAVLNGASEIVPGNVLGSNIANIFLILGVGSIVGKQLSIRTNLLPVQLPVLIFSSFFLAITLMDGMFKLGEAILFIVCLIIYMTYSISNEKTNNLKKLKTKADKIPLQLKPVLVLIISSLFIYIGAKYTIYSIIKISEIINIGTEIIAVTVVALGTSLPELTVTISAVKKKRAEIVIGNVLGSNVFNTFAVMGFSGVLGDLKAPENLIDIGIPVLLAASILFFIVIVDKKMSQWEGWLFIVFYAFFIGKSFGMF